MIKFWQTIITVYVQNIKKNGMINVFINVTTAIRETKFQENVKKNVEMIKNQQEIPVNVKLIKKNGRINVLINVILVNKETKVQENAKKFVERIKSKIMMVNVFVQPLKKKSMVFVLINAKIILFGVIINKHVIVNILMNQ